MKVAFCSPWNIEKDGIADYGRYLVRSLERCGVQTDVLPLTHYCGEAGSYRQLARRANESDVCHVQFNYVYFNGELPYRNRFDAFAGRLRVPLVMTVHEVRVGYQALGPGSATALKRAVFNATLPLWNGMSRSMHRRIYAAAERIIVHSGPHRDSIARLLDTDSPIRLIPHGIPRSAAGIMKDEAKKKFGLAGRTVLTIFGFIGRRKGYELALDALSGLSDDVCLLIAGGIMKGTPAEREYYSSLTQTIARRRLSGRVAVTGYVNEADVPDIMAATDIALAPFESTSASGALSLCLAHGKAVVASDIGVHREIAARIPCLALFRARDSVDLTRAIRAVSSDAARRDRLSGEALRYAAAYSYDAIAADTIDVYREVAEGRVYGSA